MNFSAAFADELDDLLRWRRDVRHFRRDPLPDGLLESLLERAALAPSVGYAQPWRFVRVDSEERRAAVIASFERANAAALSSYEGEDAQRCRRCWSTQQLWPSLSFGLLLAHAASAWAG